MKKIIFILLLLTASAVFFKPEGLLNGSLKAYLYLHGVKFKQLKTAHFSIGYFYSEEEHDKTVILLHGLGGKAASTWFTVLPELSKHVNVIAPDLLLANLVEDGSLSYSLSQDINLLSELLAGLHIQKASFVGLSVGGWIAAKMAIARPELCESLVLIDSAGLGTASQLQSLASRKENFGSWFYENLFYSRPPVAEFLVLPILKSMNKLGPLCREFLERNLYNNHKLKEQLYKISCPTLILWGREDKIIPVAFSHQFKHLIRGSRLHILEQCGHAVVWDKRNELPAILSDFILKGGASPSEGEL